ncbi:flagellinolysin [Candidatus Dependentiae bacterium]|nr:flagellinolysin [Candidatus Dependentiae bacterium]
MQIYNPVTHYSVRQLEKFNIFSNKSLEKLSAGYRINRASDDAAGLAISEKLRTQVNGLSQAEKNILDGISLVQTAESAYSEITDILQRVRTLAVQTSNDTLTDEDRELVQLEVAQLLSEIDRYETAVEFNNIKLLQGTVETNDNELSLLQQYLNDNWIAVGQQMANMIYDMSGNVGGPLEVILDAGAAGGTLAYVATWTSGNNVVKQELHIELADFQPVTLPNGGSSPTFYNDRIILHEMIHATHAWHSDGVYSFNTDVPTWFKEAAAEYSHGANDRVLYDGGMTAGGAASIRTVDLSNWGGTSKYYSAAYEAAMYMNRTYGNGAGDTDGDGSVLDQVFKEMETGNSFDSALDYIDDGVINASLNESGFLNDFSNDVGYDAQIQADASFFYNGGGFNGGTGGYWAIDGGIGGGGKTAEDTVDDLPGDVLGGYTLTFTNFDTSSSSLNEALNFQVGANRGEKIIISLNQINTQSLGINNLNLSTRASSESAIDLIDSAIAQMSGYRSDLGAKQNRLEHIYNFARINIENQSASESRIRDTDFAAEMVEYTKNNVMIQAAQNTVSKANQIQYSNAMSAINGTEGLEISNQKNSERMLNNAKKSAAAVNADMEKLSSGKRINRAADDAAGLAISEKFLTQINGLDQANRNVKDGISLLQITDGALEEVKSLLQRINVLSVQAANDTLTNEDRNHLQLEIDQLLNEIDRVTSSADFNGINLLRQASGLGQTTPIVLTYLSSLLNISRPGVNSNLRGYGPTIYGDSSKMIVCFGNNPGSEVNVFRLDIDGSNPVQLTNLAGAEYDPSLNSSASSVLYNYTSNGLINTYDLYITDTVGTMVNTQIAPSAFFDGYASWNTASDSEISFISNRNGSFNLYKVDYGADVAFGSGDDVVTQLTANVNPAANMLYSSFSPDGTKIAFISDIGGSYQVWTVNSDGTGLTALTNTVANIVGSGGPSWSPDGSKILYSASVAGTTELFYSNSDNSGSSKQVTYIGATSSTGGIWDPNSERIYYQTNKSDAMALDIYYADLQSSGGVTTSSPQLPVYIHNGPNSNQTQEIERRTINTSAIGLTSLSISTRNGAESALNSIQNALNVVNSASSYFGAIQNRLEINYDFNSSSNQEHISSRSMITDSDFPSVFTNYTKNQIINNAAIAMLSQANINSKFLLKFI